MIKTDERFDINYCDPSSMCAYSRCPAKYLLGRLMGITQPDSNTIAMDFGTDMHAAFPHCYEEDISCIETAITDFSIGWDKRKHGESDKKRTTLKARDSLAEFHRVHKPDVCPYDFIPFAEEIRAETSQAISANELPFVVDIGADLPFAGRIDAVVQMKTGRDKWALDYKTTSEISARYFANFENAPATVGYTLALKTVLCSLADDVQGLIIEAVRVSPSRAESQSYYAFVNSHQIEMFIENMKYIAEDILKSNEKGEWRQDMAACAPYSMFGQPGRFCEYKDICTIGDWREMVKYYKQSAPFHPFTIER